MTLTATTHYVRSSSKTQSKLAKKAKEILLQPDIVFLNIGVNKLHNIVFEAFIWNVFHTFFVDEKTVKFYKIFVLFFCFIHFLFVNDYFLIITN